MTIITREYLASLSKEEFNEIEKLVANEQYSRNSNAILKRNKRYREDPEKKYAGKEYMNSIYKKNKKNMDAKKKKYNADINAPTVELSKQLGVYKSRWSAEDDKELLKLRADSIEYAEIATILKRTVKALKTRFFRLMAKQEMIKA